jgi:hypothetical protein
MTDTCSMRIVSIYKLARTKLSTECAQVDDNLLLVVGHAYLLDALVIRLGDLDLEDETQRFNEEHTTLRMAEDERETNCKPILAIGKRNTPLKRACYYVNTDLTCTKIAELLYFQVKKS